MLQECQLVKLGEGWSIWVAIHRATSGLRGGTLFEFGELMQGTPKENDLYCPKCHARRPGVACGQGEGTCQCGHHTSRSQLTCTRHVSRERFRPRLITFGSNQLVQVHPETIEVFQQGEYLCQVKWIDGELVCPQGGLPRPKLEIMFREANA